MAIINGDWWKNNLIGTSSNDTIYGSSGNDTVIGNEGDDYIEGGDDNDSLLGGAGNDTIVGWIDQGNFPDGPDIMIGGVGDDIYYLENSDNIIEYENEGNDTLILNPINGDSYILGANLENLALSGTTSTDVFGNELNNSIMGNSRNNKLYGETGDDTLDGGPGWDSLYGGSGNDCYIYNLYHEYGTGHIVDIDTIIDDDGIDTVIFGTGIDKYNAIFYKSENNLAINYRDYTLVLQNWYLEDKYKIDVLKFADNSFITKDDIINKYIIGTQNDETLSGTTDNNLFYGGLGNDTYLVNIGDGQDTINDSQDINLIQFGSNISKDGIILTRQNDNLNINYSLTDRITLIEWFGYPDRYRVEFADGTFFDKLNEITIGSLDDDIYFVDKDSLPILENSNGGNDTVQANISYSLPDNIENLTLQGGSYQNLRLSNGKRVRVYGNPLGWANYLDWYQGDNSLKYAGDCGIVACENVLIQTGILNFKSGYAPSPDRRDSLETSLVNYAVDNYLCNWSDEYSYFNGGTTSSNIVDILNNYGISAGVQEEASFEDIANCIKNNECVIAQVDSGVLWGYWHEAYEFNHVVLVTGVAYNTDESEILGFYICDSGRQSKSDAARFVSYDLFDRAYSYTSDELTYIHNTSNSYGYWGYELYIGDTVIVDTHKLLIDNLTGTGNELDNSITGNDGRNILKGLAGNDTLDGRGYNDTLYGGTGDDTYYIENRHDRIIEYSGQGNDTVCIGSNYTLGAYLENLTLTGESNINGTGNSYNNTITGNSGNNILNGGSGNDVLIENEGNDKLIGGTGIDTMSGGAGDDIYYIDNTADHIIEDEAAGVDLCNSTVSYVLEDNVENLILTGTRSINGTGNELANSIKGNNYNNILDGGIGTDILVGDHGNDTYCIDDINDVIIEYSGQGIDTVKSTIDYLLENYLENLTLLGTDNINATGNSYNNTIKGNSGNNTIDGKSGNDRLEGAGGNDSLVGGSGNDTYAFILNDGLDTISDISGSDRIYFNKGIARANIAIFKDASNNLIIDYGDTITSTTHQIIVQNQFAGNPIEKLQLSNGAYLSSTDINHIIKHISSYDTAHTEITIDSIDDVKSEKPLMDIIAAHWHN